MWSLFIATPFLVSEKNIEGLDIQVDDVGGVHELHPLDDLPDEDLAFLLGQVEVRGRQSLKQISTWVREMWSPS